MKRQQALVLLVFVFILCIISSVTARAHDDVDRGFKGEWELKAVLQVWAPQYGEYGQTQQPTLEAESRPIPWGLCAMYKQQLERFYDHTFTWDATKPTVVCERRLVRSS